jgi:hypothetical protein
LPVMMAEPEAQAVIVSTASASSEAAEPGKFMSCPKASASFGSCGLTSAISGGAQTARRLPGKTYGCRLQFLQAA